MGVGVRSKVKRTVMMCEVVGRMGMQLTKMLMEAADEAENNPVFQTHLPHQCESQYQHPHHYRHHRHLHRCTQSEHAGGDEAKAERLMMI